MQLRALARQARGGSMTLLRDIAQAAGPVGYRSWEELLGDLDVPFEIEELRYAYRVPAEIMQLALPLLSVLRPMSRRRSRTASAVRPRGVGAIDVLADAVAAALAEAEREGSVRPHRARGPARGRRGAARRGARHDSRRPERPRREGLEFDRVVIAEPAAIVAEAGGVDGLRALYGALTCATKTLVLVHAPRFHGSSARNSRIQSCRDTRRGFKRSPLRADSGGMRSVTGICVGFGTIAGGFVPELWGASGFSLLAVLTSALGGAAGLWAGVKFSA